MTDLKFFTLYLYLLTITLFGSAEEVLKSSARDSYLDAYNESHRGKSQLAPQMMKNREYITEAEKYPYPAPSYQYGVPTGPQYGPPSAPQYGPPIDNFGPQYGPPGPPKPVYGPPPSFSQNYGPPAPVYGPPPSPLYSVPYAFLSILDKLKQKLDLFLIGKILLKLVIFKKFVSFIAIICLLLFIPSLKKKLESSNDNNDSRNIKTLNHSGNDSLDSLTAFIIHGIEHFKKEQETRRKSTL